MKTLRLYFASIRMLMQSKLQYRASFMMNIFAQFIMIGGELLSVILLIDRYGDAGMWTGNDILFIFGLLTISFFLVEMFGRGFTGSFSAKIQNGTLDTVLLRPRGVFTQIMCSDIDLRRASCVLVGIAACLTGGMNGKLRLDFVKWLVLAEAVAMTGILILALFLIEAVFAIFSVKSIEAVNCFTYGGRSCCQYPVNIYPVPLRILFTFVAPYGLTLHVPAAYVLGKPLYGWPVWTAFVCPLAGLAAFFIMYLIFQRAIRHYRSTGN